MLIMLEFAIHILEMQCLTSNDCDVQNPFCDEKNICRECLKDEDCPGLSACDANFKCVPCTDDSSCVLSPTAPVCSSELEECVECVSNANCTRQRPFCDFFLKKCVECESDSSCPSQRPRCDFSNNAYECVACIDSNDCPIETPICFENECLEVCDQKNLSCSCRLLF